MQKAATQRCRRDSSRSQAAGGQTEVRSAPERRLADRAKTKARARAHSQHRSRRPVPPAATACNPRIAPPAAQNPQRTPPPAPHSCAKDPAPADQATSRLQLCDAAQAKARARARQAQTNAPATAPRAINQTQLASRSPAPQQAPPRANRAAKAAHATHSQPGSPGAVHRPAPERSCASSRAAQQHPQAQLPAPQHQAPRAADPPAASCRPNRPPRKHSPTPQTVRASNRLRIDTSTSRLERIRLIRRVATSEWPPSAKKSSSIPTRSTPRTSANSAHSNSSCGLRGRRPTEGLNSGAGSAERSSFPFAVSGNPSRTTIAEGTMYSGSRAPTCARNSPASATQPAAKTT